MIRKLKQYWNNRKQVKELKKAAHHTFLVNIYTHLISLSKEGTFSPIIYQQGLDMLNNGVDPSRVENYVEGMLTKWRRRI